MKRMPMMESYCNDLLVLAEPLDCVMHAYRRLPKSFAARVITIYGAGPIGALHVIQCRQRFPFALIQIVEPNASRRALAALLFPFVSLFQDDTALQPSDLSVVATSCAQASLAAINNSAPAGIAILFSGIDHRSKAELPFYEGNDLEAIHRNEEVRVVSRTVRLLGSSGYHRYEIDASIRELMAHPEAYKSIQTGTVHGVSSHAINGQNAGGAAIIRLLKDETLHEKHLKVVFRVCEEDYERPRRVELAGAAGEIALRSFRRAPLAPDRVRLRMQRFSICQTDRRVLMGTKSAILKPGLVLGHEGLGIIESVGSQLPTDLIGFPCIALPHFLEDDDALGVRGLGYLSKDMRHLGIHIDGVFATHADLPYSCIHPIAPLIHHETRRVQSRPFALSSKSGAHLGVSEAVSSL